MKFYPPPLRTSLAHSTPEMSPLFLLLLQCAVLWVGSVTAQPASSVQKGITAAIRAAANATSGNVDYTKFVNVFIGTDNFGDVW